MQTENYFHREYEIQVTHKDVLWQAAIYPTKPGQLTVDWESENISAGTPIAARDEAIRRIDRALDHYDEAAN